MLIWSYIGIATALVCFLMPLGDALVAKNRIRAKLAAIIFITAVLLCLTAILYPNMSDSIFNSSATEVVALKSSDHLVQVVLYQEKDTGKYFLLGHNDTNLLQPTYRHYLDTEEAEGYITQYESLSLVKDNLVNNINKIVNP